MHPHLSPVLRRLYPDIFDVECSDSETDEEFEDSEEDEDDMSSCTAPEELVEEISQSTVTPVNVGNIIDEDAIALESQVTPGVASGADPARDEGRLDIDTGESDSFSKKSCDH